MVMSDLTAHGRRWKRGVVVHADAAQVRLAHDAAESLARVGCYVVSMMEPRWIHGKLPLRVEDHEVGVGAWRQLPFAIQSREARRSLRHPVRDLRKRPVPRFGAGPYRRQRHLDRRDAAPRMEKITRLQLFQVRRS